MEADSEAVQKFRQQYLRPEVKTEEEPLDVKLKRFREQHLAPAFRAREAPQQPDHKHVAIALLSHDAKMLVRNGICIAGGLLQLAQKGIEVTLMNRDGDSMVARGRSYLASQFLQHPTTATCTDLVFIDCDLQWESDELIRLVTHPVDVVGMAYPYKDDNGNFPLRWRPDGIFEDEKTGLWCVQATTPGFFRVSRRALERIVMECPWLEYSEGANPAGMKAWMFFDNLHRTNGVHDEGYIFCERWRMCGGQAWLDPHGKFHHIGLKAYYHGSVAEWLQKKTEAVDRLFHEHRNMPDLKLAKRIDEIMRGDPPEDTYENYGAAA